MASVIPIIFKNATIISFDHTTGELRALHQASLLVKDGKIAEVSEAGLEQAPTDAEVVDASNKIISPGFIDTHHHVWQSQYRSIAANTYLNEYFLRYGWAGPASKHFTPDDVYIGQLAGLLELIDSGTTTVLDFAHGGFTNAHVDAAVNASFESGLRVFHAHFLQPAGHEQSFRKFRSMLQDERFSDRNLPVKLGLSYDSWASAPIEQNMEVIDTVIEHNKNKVGAPVTTLACHYVGGPYGATNSPTYLDSLPTSIVSQPGLDKKIPVIFAHATSMDTKDATIVRRNPHVSISTTPESEAHYGHTSHGAEMYPDCGSLGVDTHFTFNSYMPSQARLWLQMLRTKWYRQTVVENQEIPNSNPVSVEDAFLLMTRKGGEALGRPDLGVIQEGAQADLVVFDRNRPSMWGLKDPIAAVVLHSCAGDVSDVMVAGKWLKRNGKILSPLTGLGEGVEVEDVKRRFEESARRIQDIWEKLDPVVLKEGDTGRNGMSKFAKTRTVGVKRR